MLQIPFYHAEAEGRGSARLAKSADIILAGYRETVGAGERITSKPALMEKATLFNLPADDYACCWQVNHQ